MPQRRSQRFTVSRLWSRLHAGAALLLAMLALAAGAAAAGTAPCKPGAPADVLRVNGVYLPGLLESNEGGPYLELLRLILSHGRPPVAADIEVLPGARVFSNIANGRVDFGFPMLKVRDGADAGLPYRLSTEKIGVATFVIYSRAGEPLTRAAIQAAAARGKPYAIEAPPADWGFPTARNFNMGSALRKIAVGRLDALIWAQEEADIKLRELKLTHIQRAHFGDFDEVFLIPRSPRGDLADCLLTQAVRAARKGGRLQAAYAKVHLPYDDWQTEGGRHAAPPTRQSRSVRLQPPP